MINLITDLISFTQPTNLDRESLSVIESIAKIKKVVNECITQFNNLENKTDEDYRKFIDNITSYKNEMLNKYNELIKSNDVFKQEFKDLIEDMKTFNVTLEYIKTQSEFIQELAKINQDKIDKASVVSKDELNAFNTEITQHIENVKSSLEDTAKQSVNYVNLLKYGADNTGVNGCSTILNNILSSYGDENITIYIPKGNFLIDDTILITSNTTITGEGTLVLNKSYGLHGKNVKNVTISDITIKGKVIDYHTYFEECEYITIKNVKHNSDTYGFAFMFFHCNYVIFENNVLKSTSTHEWDDGVHFVGNHIKIINNYIETYDDCVSFGLHNITEADTKYKDIYISGNTLKSKNARSVMFYYNASGYTVHDIIIENNNCYGSIKMKHDDGLTDIVFYNIIIAKNNVQEDGTIHGIDVGACQYVTIQNNIIKFKKQQGINFINEISDIDIIDNTIIYIGDNTESGIYYYCINMSNATTVNNIFISNNKLVNKYIRGIAPKGNNIVIINNFFNPIVGVKNTLYSLYASWGDINFLKFDNNSIVSNGVINQHLGFNSTYNFNNIFINNNNYSSQVGENFITGVTPTSANNNNAIA